MKTRFKISITINIILIILLCVLIWQLRKPVYLEWLLYSEKTDIVMFGDSHTSRGDWNNIKGQTVLKMGYSGFTSSQLNIMLPKVFKYNPESVFIQCGGNDIGQKCFSVQHTMNNLKLMADTLKSHSVKPVFQKLLYSQTNPARNLMIDSINNRLEKYCHEENIDLIDIGKFMYDSTGLKPSLAADHVHLNKIGYQLWYQSINDYLKLNNH